jgi:hypothetical protein
MSFKQMALLSAELGSSEDCFSVDALHLRSMSKARFRASQSQRLYKLFGRANPSRYVLVSYMQCSNAVRSHGMAWQRCHISRCIDVSMPRQDELECRNAAWQVQA